MSPTRPLAALSLSALLAAGAFASPAPMQTPPKVTLKDFLVQPEEIPVPCEFFHRLTFLAEDGTVSLVELGAGKHTLESFILPGFGPSNGVYTIQENYQSLWSQPLGKPATFVLEFGKDNETLRGADGTTLWSLLNVQAGDAADYYRMQPGTTIHMSLTHEQESLTITKRTSVFSLQGDQTIGSEEVPVLRLTSSTSDGAEQPIETYPQQPFLFTMGTFKAMPFVPNVEAPAIPGIYKLIYRDAQGKFLKGLSVEVWKTERVDPANELHQPFQVLQYELDANGKPMGDELTYFVGKPEQTPLPLPHQNSPSTFRLIGTPTASSPLGR